ncbi:Putative transposase of IS4/5 family [Nitrosomonas sp. Nm132]|nr:Putative transposase of IS4/5 family [Nitrosomonas sp. Nm132]
MKSMYQSDLSEEEWGLVSHQLEHKDPRGKKPIHSKCAIVNAILYISTSGAQWRMLPKDYPPWKIVYDTSLLTGFFGLESLGALISLVAAAGSLILLAVAARSHVINPKSSARSAMADRYFFTGHVLGGVWFAQ